MNIVVLVKQVPDTWAERKLTDADGTLDRASVDGLINELDEYAIEEGLQIAEAQRAAGAVAQVLAETGFDLVICGSESTDARMGVMAAMLAERLGVPQVSLASKVEID